MILNASCEEATYSLNEDVRMDLWKYKEISVLVCIWNMLKISAYLQFQLFFAIIHESHYTFWYYSWVPLYYSANFYFNL